MLSECLLPLFCFMQKRRRKQSRGMTRVKEQVVTGLLSHFVHRMDSFLGKNPSFYTEGGYCLWTSSFVTEAGRCVDVTGSAWV